MNIQIVQVVKLVTQLKTLQNIMDKDYAWTPEEERDNFVPLACHQEVVLKFEKVNNVSLHNQTSASDNEKDSDIQSHTLVSVIIPCYNQAEFLEEAVSSVAVQTYANWECIIVNDGSKDKTTEIANKLISHYSGKKIRLLEKVNGGLSSARNAGISIAKGEYFIPLDADDKLKNDFIEKTLKIIEMHPKVGFVYSNIQHFGNRSDVFILPEFNAETLINRDNIVCVCSLVIKEVWEQVNGYNEKMKEGYEDWNFWIGAVEKGWLGYRINETLFNYRKRNTSMLTDSNKKREKLFATIVLNHQALYSDETINAAREIVNKKSLTITYLINSILGVTGGNQTLLNQANQLVEAGLNVNIVTYTDKPDWFNLKANLIKGGTK